MGQIFSFGFGPRHCDITGTSSVDSLSDQEVLNLFEECPDEDAIGFRDPNRIMRQSLVWPILHDTVAKPTRITEVFMMAYITAHTTIPIPKIRRVLNVDPNEEYNPWDPTYAALIMDRVDGEPLQTAWPNMSWWGRLRVIWYIRAYVRQLHSMPVPYPNKPGPFEEQDRRYVSWGRFFTPTGCMPCESFNEMADWYDRRRFDAMVAHHMRTGNLLSCPKFDRNQRFVVCHGDINPRNIIVDRKGIPWLIDFGEAGVFPIWMDYAKAAMHFQPGVDPEDQPPWLWRWATRFMFGNYKKFAYDYLYVMGRDYIWRDDVIDFPLDYFTKLGIDVDS